MNADSEAVVRYSLEEKYNRLGSITFAEAFVMGLLAFTIVLWFLMRPQFIHGWADYLPYGRLVLYCKDNKNNVSMTDPSEFFSSQS